MQLEFTLSPALEDIGYLTEAINAEPGVPDKAYPFAFFMREEQGQIIAGCNGSVIFGSIYTDQLWVDRQYRRQGLGKQLMAAVHAYGKKVGCNFASVHTMSFQNTRGFYESLGYTLEYERPGYLGGASCLCLKRPLN